MESLLLLLGVALLVVSIRWHIYAQANTKTNVEKDWFERFFSGDRASKENLTELGLRYRKQSNLSAMVGLCIIVLYVWLRNVS